VAGLAAHGLAVHPKGNAGLLPLIGEHGRGDAEPGDFRSERRDRVDRDIDELNAAGLQPAVFLQIHDLL